MGVRCLGTVTIEPANLAELMIQLHKLDELGENEKVKKLSSITYFHLGRKRYIPLTQEGEVDQSEDRCKATLECSKEKPQSIGEVVESRPVTGELRINAAMINCLWLYDGKLYQTNRNDYSQEQVRLLILDFLGKEKKKFEDLEQRFKKE